MKHFKIQFTYLSLSLLFIVGFFSAPPLFAQQEISSEPLLVTEVNSIVSYPYFHQGGFDGQPGLCIIASFDSSEDSTLKLRYAPFDPNQPPSWTYVPSSFYLSAGSSSVNAAIGSQMSSNVEYVFQFLEIGGGGEYHFITPEVGNDEIGVMCTPTQNGNLGTCELADTVVDVCPPSMVLDGPSVAITNTSTSDSVIVFNLVPNGFTTGDVLYVVASPNLADISEGSFDQAPITVPVSVIDNVDLSVSLVDLLPGTTYYVTVLNESQMMVLSSGQNGYVSATTTGGDEDTPATPVTISVDIDGSFPGAEDVSNGLIQCGFGEIYDCDFNALLATIDRIIKFMLYIVILPLSAILFAYAGIKLIIAGAKAKESELKNAKDMFRRVLVGLIIAMGAWLLIKFLLVILGYTDASGIISQILGISLTP